ncbi:MAG: ATP-binding protein, partial [Acidobacteriaceae bacterium]
MKRLSVGVGADHIDSLARARKPLLAIVELIWNALDADAKRVSVILTPNGLAGLDTVQVEDDGDGISPDEFDIGFGQLGDSWKKRAERTKTLGRALHGKRGVGRYRALSLGGRVVWNTRFVADGQVFGYEITFDSSDRRTVIATDPTPSTESRGTTVTIANPTPKLGSVEFDAVKPELTAHFALYLRQYPDVELRYDGAIVKPDELISRSTDIAFDFVTENGQ